MTDLTERLRGWATCHPIAKPGIGVMERDALEAATTLETLTQENARLREALNETLRVYVELAESGDAGFWDPEKEPHVLAARKALGCGDE